MAEKSISSWVTWEPEDSQEGSLLLGTVVAARSEHFFGADYISSRSATLSFYKDHRLVEVTFVRTGEEQRAYFLNAEVEVVWLNGDSDVIHEVNEAESLRLTGAVVSDYLKFFLYFLRAGQSAFVLVETPEEIEDGPGPSPQAAEPSEDDNPTPMTLEAARACAQPLKLEDDDHKGPWRFKAIIAYQEMLFRSVLVVQSDGQVEMVDDDPIGELGILRAPSVPDLKPALQSFPDSGEGSGVREQGAETFSGGMVRDSEVTKAVVSVLLEEAIRELTSNTRPESVLLRQFNWETQSGGLIKQLTKLTIDTKPIIIIESTIPFVEDFVAALLGNGSESSEHASRASVSGDDQTCAINVSPYANQYLLSFHTYRTLVDVERSAHELALADAMTLIGCNRAADVPEPLRRVSDLVISLPPIDRRLFPRIFESVFHAAPGTNWDAPGMDWTQYLVPEDFHTPRRLGLGTEDAITMLRERVDARLEQVSPGTGPRLDELHGMGEARQVAEDLIEDIRAAQNGAIPWSAVDRGMLLVGAPGTGKTTLARAIAKGCDVKFVCASAASWQSAGALDSHLRSMRADFDEARRYAPAILFIDELDSIGSREHLDTSHSTYQTDVINALLEQIQGIQSTETVIVIGATNYPENVDPALRRAGRLDQVVAIPLPNIDGLEQIYEYYLARFKADGGKLGEVDARALAELSFGLTGADVEFFIRGGARRARRLGRPLGQADLVAEVTGRPRRADSAPRLGSAEMRRVAIHEAGHALARLLSSTQGDELAFATIVPRLDGSLGFVASVPNDTNVMTRRTMLEYLQTALAGRAAEEIEFGSDDVGAGAGGSSPSSDLAAATRFATLVVCQSGLGEDGSLLWTSAPNSAQEKQIEVVLRNAYRNILTRLRDNRTLLDRIAGALVARQELSGKELRELAARQPAT
jgi:ATP-dependent Zn protease